jgi:hypothetical protein
LKFWQKISPLEFKYKGQPHIWWYQLFICFPPQIHYGGQGHTNGITIPTFGPPLGRELILNPIEFYGFAMHKVESAYNILITYIELKDLIF